MKIFKRIYYPLMAVLFILVFTLSFVNTMSGNKQNGLGSDFVAGVNDHLDFITSFGRNSIYEDRQREFTTYITTQLASKAGLRLAGESMDGDDTVYEYRMLDGKPVGSYAIQNAVMDYDTLSEIASAKGITDTTLWEVNKELTNIVVYIPGTKTTSNYMTESKATGDVVMMMAHYDSRIEGVGASSSGVQVAAMLQNIIHLTKNNLAIDNDLLFVFTDASEEGMYGAYTFKHQFKGFDEVYSRVKLGVNFDALGNSGSLVLVDSSSNNYNLISTYGKEFAGGTIASSALNLIYGGVNECSDFNIFDSIPSLSFANVGGRRVNGTAHDTIENVTDSSITQQSNIMYNVIETFAKFDLSKLESNQNAVFFSYFDAFTIVYPYAVSYVFGALMIGLAIGIIVLNKRNGVFKWTSTGSGALVQLLSIIGTVIILFVLYYLISLFISITGIMSIRAIGRLIVENAGLLISLMLLSVVLSAYLSIQFRKLFAVKSADIVRGNVILLGLVGTILAFAAPSVAYVFAIPALLELITLLLLTAFSGKFKDKFGYPIGKLFPYMLPVIIVMPFVMPLIILASMALSTMFIPLFMILFIMLMGFITPYCVLLTGYMERLFDKLPKPSMRVEKEITETVEDKAKKGKFVEKTSIVIVKEKHNIRYKHAYSAVLLAVIFTIMATVFSAVGYNAGYNYTNLPSYRNAIYSSSMVLVWEQNNNDSASSYLHVEDFAAFRYIDEAISGFSWSFGKDAFTKSVSSSEIIKSGPSITANGNVYSFSPFSPGRSLISLKLTDAAKITKLTIESNEGEIFELENEDRSETIIINLPYKFGGFKLTSEGVDHINLQYNEAIMDIGNSIANLAEQEDWKQLMAYYAGNESVTNYINSGIVFKITKDLF